MKQYIPLGDVISKASVDRCGNAQFPILSITMKDGLVLQDEKFKKRIASVDTSDYKVIPRGKLVQGIHIDEANFGIQDIVDVGIVSPAYKVWDVNSDVVFPKYLEMVMRSPRSIAFYKSKLNGSVNRRGRMTDGDFLGMPVPYFELSEQMRIVDIMIRSKAIIEERMQQLLTLDDLIKARFVEMFGDMLVNPLNWKQTRLDGVSNIVSGITKGRKPKSEELFEVPYMAVSNVKDGYIDWTTVKTIPATRTEIEQYRLLPFDVLMTEGGDPDKLGRGAIIHEPPANCIHQNHIFRVRLNQECLLPVFFAQYLQQQRAKRYFLGCAKQTTGIASINMKQLSALPVLSPPIELQRQYAAFVAQIDKSKFAIQQSLKETQTLFDSLMQQYFG